MWIYSLHTVVLLWLQVQWKYIYHDKIYTVLCIVSDLYNINGIYVFYRFVFGVFPSPSFSLDQ